MRLFISTVGIFGLFLVILLAVKLPDILGSSKDDISWDPSIVASPDIQEKWQSGHKWPGDSLYNKVRGECTSPFILSGRFDELENGTFVHQEGDVWIATYPKSGTTWTQKIVGLMNECPLPGVFDCCPWPEVGMGPMFTPTEKLNNLPKSVHGTRCFKAHWVYNDYMKNDNIHRIYIMRNVMDVAVSFYHHTKTLNFIYQFDGDFNEFFDVFIGGHIENGNWFDHIASWWPHRHDPHVLFLRYEEMKNDPAKEMQKIANFMNISLSEQRLSEIVEKTSFKNMKKKMESDPFFGRINNFFRKGIVGDSASVITESQKNRLVEEYNQKLKPLGVPIDWVFPHFSG